VDRDHRSDRSALVAPIEIGPVHRPVNACSGSALRLRNMRKRRARKRAQRLLRIRPAL